jgi:hypothetical protein
MSLLQNPVQHCDETKEESDEGDYHRVDGGDYEVLILDKSDYLLAKTEKKKSSGGKRKDTEDFPYNRTCFASKRFSAHAPISGRFKMT